MRAELALQSWIVKTCPELEDVDRKREDAPSSLAVALEVNLPSPVFRFERIDIVAQSDLFEETLDCGAGFTDLYRECSQGDLLKEK